MGRPLTPLWRTTDWLCLRFHEGAAHPRPHYGDQALKSWANRLGDAPDSYVYFNDDLGGAAGRNAVRFAALTHTPNPRPLQVS